MNTRVSDTWERGDPYERYIGRWSRRLAPRFLSWLAVPEGRHWLDVGCGTGALCAAILEHCAPASVAGVEPSEGFLASARQNLAGRAALHKGVAASIPLADASVEVVVCGLVLNFVPDPRAALTEMRRVVAGGGKRRTGHGRSHAARDFDVLCQLRGVLAAVPGRAGAGAGVRDVARRIAKSAPA